MSEVLKTHLPKPFLVLAAIEWLAICLSLIFGYSASFGELVSLSEALSYWLVEVMVFSFAISAMMFSMGLYNGQFSSEGSDIVIRLCVSFVLAFFVLSVILFMLPQTVVIWRSALGLAMIAAFSSVLVTRYFFLRVVDFGALKRRVLILGVGNQAARLDSLERTGRAFGFVCVGYLKVAGEDPMITPSRIVSGVNSIADFVERARVDEIVVAVEDRRGCLPMHLLIDCRLSGTPITDYATFFERETGSIDLKALQPSWFIFSDGFPGGRVQQVAKRLLDLSMSLLLLLFFAPLMLATAIAIKLESEGPIFYRQVRVGYRGLPFNLLKFRSMRKDAEKDGVPRWADEDDPRITGVGAFLRKSRIDELPQLLNVVKGDMSFVGPRPERPYFVDQLSEKIPYYKERHWIKPGITGWAQLNYDYGASIEDARKKLQYDLYYVKHYSIVLDLIIILQTIRVIFWAKGAR